MEHHIEDAHGEKAPTHDVYDNFHGQGSDRAANTSRYAARDISPERPESFIKPDPIVAAKSSKMEPKSIIRLLVLVVCFGVFCSLVSGQTTIIYYRYDDQMSSSLVIVNWGEIVIGSCVAGLALLWETADLITRRVRGRGIGLMARIVVDFIFFLGMLTGAGFMGLVVVSAFAPNYYSSLANGNKMRAAGPLLVFILNLCLAGMYLALFIIGVKENKRIKRARNQATMA